MTGSIFFYVNEKMDGTGVEWKDLDTNRFFYGNQGQSEKPGDGAAVNTVYKSVKNESKYILIMITSKAKGGVVPITGSSDLIDADGASFFCVIPNTTCSSTGQNWAIGLGVFIGVMFIIIVALIMSGVVVFHTEGGAGFGYNQR